MAYDNLQDFITDLEEKDMLKRIRVEVDNRLEITEITDRVCKSGGPALLFENVRGYGMPVLTNTFGAMDRVRLAMGGRTPEDIAGEIEKIIQLKETPATVLEKFKALPKLARLSSFLPRKVRTGLCKEVTVKDRPSMQILPALKCWPSDGGNYITMPLVFTRDPKTGARNAGMYRMQVFDDRTAGMHWHTHKDGAHHLIRSGGKLPVAVAIGADPAVVYAATAPLPGGLDEMILAGFLRQKPVEMVSCETVDVEVPAGAEIVLEGYVDPQEKRMEGPFGDHTGFYSTADYYPVFHLTCITHRKKPVYQATVVGRPPMEDAFLGKLTERLFLPLIKVLMPEITDMNMPFEGVFHNCVIVSIEKRYPAQAKKVMHGLWGLGLLMLTKLIIVVDGDVNVHDLSEVAWRVLGNIDAKRDLTVVEGPVDALDHSSPAPLYGSKLGIDATRKGPEEGITRLWPEDIVMSPEIKRLVDGKWHSYGL